MSTEMLQSQVDYLKQEIDDLKEQIRELRDAVETLKPSEPASLLTELQELRAWKEAVMAVNRQWDPQALAVMLGAKPGDNVRAVIQREVTKLIERVKLLEEEVADYQTQYANWKAYAFNLEDIGQQMYKGNFHTPQIHADWRKVKDTRP